MKEISLDKDDAILDKEEFTLFGEGYIAIVYSHDRNTKRRAIFKKLADMKSFAKDLLKQYGVEITKSPNETTTDENIRLLIETIRKTTKE